MIPTQIYHAGVDIGGTKITVCIADASQILVKYYEPVKKVGDNTAVPNQVHDLITTACNDIGISHADLSGVGISTCSPFERRDTYSVVVAPNLCGGIGGKAQNDWKEIPLEETLIKTHEYKNVQIENDCVASVVVEEVMGI